MITAENNQQPEVKNLFNFRAIYTSLILNWIWFVVSILVCLGGAYIYLRYSTPIYQAHAKLLIKEEQNSRRGNSIQNASNLGIVSNSTGIENEMEILTSHSLAQSTVRDLKLYISYTAKGNFKDQLLYKNEPLIVDLDPINLEKINKPFEMLLTFDNGNYHLTGTYYVPLDETHANGPYYIDKTFNKFPTTINTRAGMLTIAENLAPGAMKMTSDTKVHIVLNSPQNAAYQYQRALSVNQTSRSTSIAQLTITDINQQRAIDYLKQLSICYNRQANEDKNQVAIRTEKFINSRLEKINSELGMTEEQLENFKKRNNMVELKMNANSAFSNQDEFNQRLIQANTQIALLDKIASYQNKAVNHYDPIPENSSLSDQSTNSLINKYNEIALERKRLLRSASEKSPIIQPLTAQLNDLNNSIRQATTQARKGMEIQRNAIMSQFNKYSGQVGATPEQERILTQIGRQQEVKSGLYLMLLQKREENSISLSATADKGKLLDKPEFEGKVSPNNSMIYLIALLIGLSLPMLIIIIAEFFHYKIEGRNDVIQLTKLPILGDVPIASDQAKTKADVVVHENQNNLMEEIFRGMRTNLQFMLKENEKVIAFTSTTSGEGKTFTAANLAVSFALLGKKVILVGLDIRKPRLAELFEIKDHHHGITKLLVQEHPTREAILSQVLPSGVNNLLDLLMAGPIPPNPAELLARKSLDYIIDDLKEIYDYIIIDTAPIGLVTDTLQVSRIINATVYLCRADYTTKDSFLLINSLAAEKKLPNMSIVINGLDMTKKKYGYYYGYGRYANYGRYAKYGYGTYHNNSYMAKSYNSYNSYGTYDNKDGSYRSKNDNSIKQ